MPPDETKSRWLTLGEAGQFLGVHPTTLREWVDAGILQVFRTPGGHRRFDLRDLERFLQQRKTTTPSRALAIAERNPLDDIRRQLDASQIARQRWYRQLTDEQRARERERGQRMMGLLIQYASRYENAEHFLSQARVLSRAHGRDAARMGLSPSNVVCVCLFFRRAILNVTHQPQDANAPNDAEGMRLYQRINEFMDEMLLSALEAYEEARRHMPLK